MNNTELSEYELNIEQTIQKLKQEDNDNSVIISSLIKNLEYIRDNNKTEFASRDKSTSIYNLSSLIHERI